MRLTSSLRQGAHAGRTPRSQQSVQMCIEDRSNPVFGQKDCSTELQKTWAARAGMSPTGLAMCIASNFQQISPGRSPGRSPAQPSPVRLNSGMSSSPMRPVPGSIRAAFSPVRPGLSPLHDSPGATPRSVVGFPASPLPVMSPMVRATVKELDGSAVSHSSQNTPLRLRLGTSPTHVTEIKPILQTPKESKQFTMPSLAGLDDVPSLELASNHNNTPR